MNRTTELIEPARKLVAEIRPILTDNRLAVVGYALTELVAEFITQVPSEDRELLLELHIETVKQLIPVVIKEQMQAMRELNKWN